MYTTYVRTHASAVGTKKHEFCTFSRINWLSLGEHQNEVFKKVCLLSRNPVYLLLYHCCGSGVFCSCTCVGISFNIGATS